MSNKTPPCSKCGIPIVVWHDPKVIGGFTYRFCPDCDPCPFCTQSETDCTQSETGGIPKISSKLDKIILLLEHQAFPRDIPVVITRLCEMEKLRDDLRNDSSTLEERAE